MRRSLDAWKRRKNNSVGSGSASRKRIIMSDESNDYSSNIGNFSSVIEERNETDVDITRSNSFQSSSADFLYCTSPFPEERSCASSIEKDAHGIVSTNSSNENTENERRPLDAPGWVRSVKSSDEPMNIASHSPHPGTIDDNPAIDCLSSESRSIDSNGPLSIHFEQLINEITQSSESYSDPSIVVSKRKNTHLSHKKPTKEECGPDRKPIEHTPKLIDSSSGVTYGGELEISPSSSGSMPPPDFCLPRIEIRDAIKYHRRLGRALSKLALSKEINDVHESHDTAAPPARLQYQKNKDRDGTYSVSSTNSTCMSTLDSSCTSSIPLEHSGSIGRLGASSNHLSFLKGNLKVLSHDKRDDRNTISPPDLWIANFESIDENSSADPHLRPNAAVCNRNYSNDAISDFSPTNSASAKPRREQLFCQKTKLRSGGNHSTSGSVSSKGSRRKLERHISFLEAHIKNFCDDDTQGSSEESSSNNGICYSTRECDPHTPSKFFSNDLNLKLTICSDAILMPNSPADDSFFPKVDDLRSPPTSTCKKYVDNRLCDITTLLRPARVVLTSEVQTAGLTSPPSTPMAFLSPRSIAPSQTCSHPSESQQSCCMAIGCNSPALEVKIENLHSRHQHPIQKIREYHQQPADVTNGDALLQNMERIKQETAAMMIELQENMRSNLKQAMEKEMEQHCSKIKLALSEISNSEKNINSQNLQRSESSDLDKCQCNAFAKNKCQEKENEHPAATSFTKKRSQTMSPSHTKSSPALTKGTPQTPVQENYIDHNALMKQLEKSLHSMEASILNKISLRMDKESSQQRQALEEIIEEKVTRVMAGTNLEIQLAIQEVKKENQRSSKKTLHRMSSFSGSSNINGDFSSPLRYPTPKRIDTGYSKPHSISKLTPKKVVEKSNEKTLEDSFADTMRVIDDFVFDCDDIVNDLDKIAFRMQDDDEDDELNSL